MRVTENQIAEALKAARGRVAIAAQTLGVTTSAVHYRIRQSPALQEIKQDAQEYALDIAEDKLFQAVEEGKGWAVCFLLKCLGKERGYIEKFDIKQDVTHQGKIEHQVTDVRERVRDRLDGLRNRLSVVPDEPFR